MKHILTILCVVFLALGASALTIRDIQYTEDSSGDSPYEGQTVTVSGVVTRALSNSAYLQDDTTAWSGILIYGVSLKSGDSITITAKVDEYNSKTELTDIVDYTLHKSNADIPGPVEVATDSVNHEKWEGVFVVCNDVEVTDVSGATFEIDDGSGPLQVYTGNYNISYSPSIGDTLMFIRGPIDVYYGTYQLLPLRNDDILEAISGTGGARVNPKYSEANSMNNYRLDVYATVDSSYGYVNFLRVRFNCDTLMDTLSFELEGADSLTVVKDSVRGRITVDIYNAMLTDTVSLRINNYYFQGQDSSGNALADTFTVYTGESPAWFQPISSMPVIRPMPDKDIMTIREVQSTSDGYNSMYRGQLVTIRGKVSGSSEIFSPLPGYIGFYLQDETGGVNIFSRDDESGNTYRRGIELIITGTVTEYNGLTEIEYSDPSTDMIIVNDTIAEVEPEILARSKGVSELNEGSLLKAEHAKVITSPVSAGTGKNFQAYNGQTLLDVRITDKSPFYNSEEIKSIKEGMLLNITGIGGQYDTEEPYNTGYQLMVRDGDDIEFIETDEDSNFTLTILPNPVAFENGETARITATALNEERITVRIFDLAGRPVTVLGENLPGSNTLIWDGRNKLGEFVTPAAYIITVDKTDNNGRTVRIVKPIVVTTELN
ncbi:MAG: DUF5689 domain-containing protein [candidate division WOR-3 bacterium]|nr:DUF5689 domain-containing protein [candidate division WOR-3 bacterium]